MTLSPNRLLLSEESQFFCRWLRHPRRIGAIRPSGRKLSAAMARSIDVSPPGVVVELGPGTGSITRALLDAGVEAPRVLLVERDGRLCRQLASRFQGVRVRYGDARNLTAFLQEASIDRVTAIVSALPLIAMRDTDRTQVIDAAFAALASDGLFVQFTYGLNEPLSGELRDKLGVIGDRYRWILSNVPPATIWRYRRKTSSAALPLSEQPLSQCAAP